MLNFIKRSIQWKLLLTMIGFVVVLVASLTFVQIRAQKRILEKELERRIELMNKNLSDRGKTLSDNLGRQAENDIASFNLSYVTELIKKAVNEDKELAYAILMASDRTAYIHTLRPELQQEILSEDEDQFAASQEAATINEYERNDDSFLEFIVPLRVSIEPWGVLRLGFTLDFLNEEIVNSRTEIAKQARDMFIRSVMTSMVFIFLSALIVLFISSRLSKPLIRLTESARQLAQGNFAAVAHIEFRSEDEVGVLADTFAEMSKNLKDSYEALREKKAEAERLQAARMESLRQLVAGIAHQMNNPIGAISSNLDISSRAIEKIKAILTKRECAWEIRERKQLVKALAILEQMNQVNQIASSGIAKIVANLRRFIRLDEAEWQIADIHEGIDNVIALMEPEFESRIRIRKDYGDLPRVYCSPSSLNQVFINLLKNASESIEGEGEIAIKTFAREGDVTIEISDTGRGIPNEHKAWIFDPGFTTKGAKVGVGLGLSICYEIVVNKHQGRIDVSSNDKGTTFTITMSATKTTKM